MQPQKTIAVRQSANTPAAAGPAAAPAPNEAATAESLGWQLRAALPPLRLHSVSLFDEHANVLWLSEGALGPDEHSVVVEAMEALGREATSNCYETGLEDGRVAIFLPVRSPQGGLVGLAMILADIKSVGDGVVERMMAPQVRGILQKVAVLLRPAQVRASQTESLKILALALEVSENVAPGAAGSASAAAGSASVALGSAPAAAGSSPTALGSAPAASSRGAPGGPTTAFAAPSGVSAAPPVAAPPSLSPQAVDDILEFELTPDLPSAAPSPSPVSAPTVSAAPTVAIPTVSTTPTAAIAPTLLPASPVAPAVPVAPAPSGGPIVTASVQSDPGSSSSGTSTGMTKSLGATDTSKALNSTTTSQVVAMPEGFSLVLDVLPFSKLRPGGRTRRFEVLPRSAQTSRTPPGFDKFALQELLAWMGSNRAAWSLEPTSFTLNLSIATLEDERFPQFVASNLKANGIAADNIGFEIAEPLCLQRRAQVKRFMTLCDKLGCFVVIDDFSLDSSLISLLRSKALRLVKIDPRLTSVALKDKLAQAMVVAIAQAVKVLGIHCAAKRVETQAGLQWLTAIGCDFAQGTALGRAQAIESLGGQPAAVTPQPS